MQWEEQDLSRRVFDIDEVSSTIDFGSLEDIIKDAKQISSCVHDSKNEACKDKDDNNKSNSLPIVTLSAVMSSTSDTS